MRCGFARSVSRSGGWSPERYNGTAPIEASSGPRVRRRLNPRGNRQLNHAPHIAAVTQVAHDTAGRAYYLRKQDEEGSATRVETTDQRRG